MSFQWSISNTVSLFYFLIGPEVFDAGSAGHVIRIITREINVSSNLAFLNWADTCVLMSNVGCGAINLSVTQCVEFGF